MVLHEGKGKKWNGLRSSGMHFQNSNVGSCVGYFFFLTPVIEE